MWFMTAWFLVWPAAWIFHAVLTGEDWWRVALVPPIWLAVVWLNARITQLETLLLGTHTLTRPRLCSIQVGRLVLDPELPPLEEARSQGRANSDADD